jgi:hypothetical protein
MPKPLLAALLTLAGSAHAHSGHGAPQAWHWHATDTAGFLTVAVLAAIALWMARDE